MNYKSLMIGAAALVALPFAASAVTVNGTPVSPNAGVMVGGAVNNGGAPELFIIDSQGNQPAFFEIQVTNVNGGQLEATVGSLANGEFIDLILTTGNQGLAVPAFAAAGGNHQLANVLVPTGGFSPADTSNSVSLTSPGSGIVNPGPNPNGSFDIVNTVRAGLGAANDPISIYIYWEAVFPGVDDGVFTISIDAPAAPPQPPQVPLPAGVVLLLTALGGLGFFRNRGRNTA